MSLFDLIGGTSGISGQVREGFDTLQQRQLGVQTGVNQQDRDLAEQSIGHTGDLARRQLEQSLPGILAQVSGQAGARGLSGSGIEDSLRLEQGNLAQTNIANMLSQQGIAQGQMLQQGAFQRSNQELTRNQQLFDSLISSFGPAQQQNQGIQSAIGGAFGIAGQLGAAHLGKS